MTSDHWKLIKALSLVLMLLIGTVDVSPGMRAEAAGRNFAPGDVFVALRTGEVQWRQPDGTLNTILVGTIPGKVEGMGFDTAGDLYVSHYCADASFCVAGNSIERFDSSGFPQGAFGSGYQCNPYSIVFDSGGRAYVGQADCTGNTLQFSATGAFERVFTPQPENRGSAWIDLAADGCTLFYTSQGHNVKRFNVCTGAQLPNFNAALFPGVAHQLRVLDDSGVIVATDNAILRLNSSGAVVRTYDVAGEPRLWYGVAAVGDGSFWASNYGSSNVYRFNLESGAVLSVFNAGTPTTTVKGLAVKKVQ